jgi:hypothetical protein
MLQKAMPAMLLNLNVAWNAMKIEPMPGVALAGEPSPLLSYGIKINEEEQKDPEHA